MCVLLGGVAAGTAYLLTREDSPPVGFDTVAAPEEFESGSVTEEAPPEASGAPLSPVERGFPTDSTATMRVEIEDLLREFHLALVDGEFQYAWSLLSSRKRRNERIETGYSGWRDAQASLSPYLDPDGIYAQIEDLEDQGVARVRVTGMGWNDPGSPCSEWSGLTWVRYEGGTWHYDPGYSTTAERRSRWQNRSGELLGVGC